MEKVTFDQDDTFLGVGWGRCISVFEGDQTW